VTTDWAKKACVFCNGELKNSAMVKSAASNCDLLIGADVGAKHLAGIGIDEERIKM